MVAVGRFRPLADRVVIQRIVQEAKTKAGILLPESAKKQVNQGTVITVGPGRLIDGQLQPVHIKEGDHVVLPEYGGMNIKFEEKEYQIFRAEDIIGVIDKE